MVQELLVGDNAFIGISHLSQEKAKAEMGEALLQNKVRVIKSAVEGGATGFTFSTCQSNLELLNYLHTTEKEILRRLNYYILVPYSQSYVRKTNISGTQALIKLKLIDLINAKLSPLHTLDSLISLKLDKLAGLFLESELLPYLKVLPRRNVKAILLHEVLTELFMAFRLTNSIEPLEEYVSHRLRLEFGLETRNFSYLYDCFSKTEYCPKYIMTPINSIGYQMAESREAAIEALNRIYRKSNIIAINILASGALSLEQSIDYLTKFKDQIYAVTTASTKPERIYENCKKLTLALIREQ